MISSNRRGKGGETEKVWTTSIYYHEVITKQDNQKNRKKNIPTIGIECDEGIDEGD